MRSSSATKLFCCSSLTENSKWPPKNIRFNAIVIDPRNLNYNAVGGSDEYARVYDLRKCQLNASSNLDRPVNTLRPTSFTSQGCLTLIQVNFLSCTTMNSFIYFKSTRGWAPSSSAPTEDLLKNEEPHVYLGHRNSKTVKVVNFLGPNDEYVLSGSACGHIFIWKKKGAKLVRLMVGDRHVINHLAPIPLFLFLLLVG